MEVPQNPDLSQRVLNEVTMIEPERLGQIVSDVEAGLERLDVILETFKKAALLDHDDLHLYQDAGKTEFGTLQISNMLNPGSDLNECMKLGVLVASASPEQINRSALPPQYTQSETLPVMIEEQAKKVANLPTSIDPFEVDLAKITQAVESDIDSLTEGFADKLSSLIDKDGVIRAGNIVEAVVYADRIRETTLEVPETALFVGRTIKCLIDFINEPDRLKALSFYNGQFEGMEDLELPEAHQKALALVGLVNNSRGGEYSKNVATTMVNNLVPSLRLRKKAELTKKIGWRMIDLAGIPNLLLGMSNLRADNLAHFKEAIMQTRASVVAACTDSAVSPIADLAETTYLALYEKPSENSMMEALLLDEYKHHALKKITNFRFAVRKIEASQDMRLKRDQRMDELGKFSLAKALVVKKVEVHNEASAAEKQAHLKNLEELQAGYRLTSKQLRQLDPGLAFTNLLRQGVELNGRSLIASNEAEDAKSYVSLMLKLTNGIRADGDIATFDRLFGDVSQEAYLTGHVGKNRAQIGPAVDWLIDQYDALLKNGGQVVPADVKAMLQSFENYLNRQTGQDAAKDTEFAPTDEAQPEDEEMADEEMNTESEQPEADASSEEPETGNIPELDEPEFPTELLGTAEKLDFEIFPPTASFEDVQRDVVSQLDQESLSYIDWHRLRLMVELRDDYYNDPSLEVNLYRSRPGSLATRLPYYALEFTHQGHTVMVADNPQYGNATYIVAEDSELGSWQEMLALSKRDTRDLGGQRLIHSVGSLKERRDYLNHKQKIVDAVVALLTAA